MKITAAFGQPQVGRTVIGSLTPVHIMSRSVRLMWRSRLRSALVLLGAILGVAGVIASVNYASGGRQQLLAQIQRLGTNVLIITPQQSRAVGGRARTGAIVTTLVERDYLAIRRELTTRARSSALAARPFLLKAGNLSKNAPVIGCEPEYFRIRNWNVSQGELFDAVDLRRSARVAVVGRTVALDLYGTESPIGQRLFINRVPFEVVGVLTEHGQGLDVANEDNQVYVPLTAAMRRLMNVDYYSSIIVEVNRWEAMDDAARTIAMVMRDHHRVSGKTPADFQIQNQKTLIDAQLAVSEKLGFLVRWIGLSGLVVSGLGILAIMWMGVKERTVEIGTRRALGATAGHIFFQMVFEAAVLSVVGGAIGLAAGWYATRVIAERASLPFVFEWPNASLALLAAIGLNLAFALLPSRRAARLNPIRALKYE